LGGAFTGAFTTDTQFFNELDESAQIVGEPMWRMPLTAYYSKQLKSNIADLNNSPVR
jgi:leucyl aminopeptidase